MLVVFVSSLFFRFLGFLRAAEKRVLILDVYVDHKDTTSTP